MLVVSAILVVGYAYIATRLTSTAPVRAALDDRFDGFLPGLRGGTRVLSAYELRDGTRIWIITKSDRSVTTILLPEEY